MESSVDAAGDGPLTGLNTALAIGLGAVLGGVARGLPIAVATIVFPGTQRGECDDHTVVECAVAVAPEIIGGILVFGFLVLFFTVGCAACGVLLLVVGSSGRRPLARRCPDANRAISDRPTPRLVRVTLGTSLLMPALWLVVSSIRPW